MRIHASVVGGLLGLVVSLGLMLRLVAVGNAPVGSLPVAGIFGCAAAVIWRDRAWIAATGAVGVAIAGMIFAIGGAGLLYIPSLVLLLVGVAQAEMRRVRRADG